MATAMAAYERTVQQRRAGEQEPPVSHQRPPERPDCAERKLYREGPSEPVAGSQETRQLAEDAERLLARRKERAAILAAAAEARMARNMGVVLGRSAV